MMFQKIKSYKSFFIVYSLCIIIIISLCVSAFYFYSSYKKDLAKSIEKNTNMISNYLQDIFEHSENWSLNMIDRIRDNPDHTKKIIDNIEYHSLYNIHYDLFFASSNNNIFYVSGFMDRSYDLKNETYIKDFLHDIDKFTIFAAPSVGSNTLREINCVTPVTDKNGKRIGIFGIGLNVFNIVQRLEDLIFDNRINYILIDTNFRIVLFSPDCAIGHDSSYFRDHFLGKEQSLFTSHQGEFVNPILIKGTLFTHYKRIKNYPLYIVVGSNKLITNEQFEIMILPRVIEMFILSVLVILFMYLFRQRFLAIASTAENARELFVKTLKMQMQTILDTLHSDCLTLQNAIASDNAAPSILIPTVDSILKSAKALETLSTEQDRPILLDVNEIVRSCKLIVEHSAFLNKVSIKTHFSPSIPLILTKEIILKQALVGMLSIAIRFFNNSGHIKIVTERSQHDAISIQMHCDGMMDFDRIEHFERHLKSTSAIYVDDLKFSLKVIRRLIESISGQIIFHKSEDHTHKIIEILIPF